MNKNLAQRLLPVVIGALWFIQSLIANGAQEETILERGPHHRVLQKVRSKVGANGQTYNLTNTLTELATGMHYWEEGQWKDSKEEVEIFQGAAVARHGQHQVIFAGNINTVGAIDMLAPDGKRFRSHPLTLIYTDYGSGDAVIIGSLQDSFGAVLPPNLVYYEDVFEGDVLADIRLSYTRAGFEQDVILITAPPPPEAYGLVSETTRLEIISEFVEAPEPAQHVEVLKYESDPVLRANMIKPDLTDARLDFGVMKMGTGQAFPMTQANLWHGVPTGKSWEVVNGRTLLAEAVNYLDIRDHLQGLPQAAAGNAPRKLKDKGRWMAQAIPPLPNGAPKRWEKNQFAKLDRGRPGFMIDYTTIISSQTNYNFRGDEKYLISGTVELYGRTTIEAGTTVLYNQGGTTNQLVFNGPIDCLTTPWNPATFTAKDDTIYGITENAPSGTYAHIALYCKDTSEAYNWHDIRVRYAKYAVSPYANVTLNLSHAQVGKSEWGFYPLSNRPMTCRNVLFYDLGYGFYSQSTTTHVEHATLHQIGQMTLDTSMPPIRMTNCLITAVTTNMSHYTGSNVETNLSDSGYFQTVGAGAHYLVEGSPLRHAGTTNIQAQLLRTLATLTTHAPELLTNAISLDTVWQPIQPRETGYPTIGYHYYPIDYLVKYVTVTNATLLLTNGVAIATIAEGIRLYDNSQLISQGMPERMNVMTRYYSVQEQDSNLGEGPSGDFTFVPYSVSGSPPSARLRFTSLAIPYVGNAHTFMNGFGGSFRFNQFELSHSSVAGGYQGNLGDTNTATYGWTNNLINRVYDFTDGDAKLSFQNNSMIHYDGGLMPTETNNTWTFKDNLLDRSSFFNIHETLVHTYNRFFESENFYSIYPTNSTELILTSLSYQSGALGNFYQPTTSPLINTGSVNNASLVGLYHFTTLTNQVKETNSWLDIGFHYVAVNPSTGLPLDEDGDGLPDYFEDRNGNGSADAGETDWTTYNTILGVGSGPGLKVFTPLDP